MNISEEQLRELVLRALSDLEAEERAEYMKDSKQTLYMLYVSPWSERYTKFLRKTEGSGTCDTVPVIPPSWKNMGYEARSRQSVSSGKVLYRSGKMPDGLNRTVTLPPVVPKNVLVKTALYISDTYGTSQTIECMKQDSRVVLLLTGPEKFSGNEKPVYRERIMERYKQVLEFGMGICSTEELSGRAPYEISCKGMDRTMACRIKGNTYTLKPDRKKKRVISLSNVEQFASNNVIYLQPGDIVTDLAKDRAKLLKIVFK